MMFTFDVNSTRAEEVKALLSQLREYVFDKFQIQENLVADGDGTLFTILPNKSKVVFGNYGTPLEREIAVLLEKLGVDLNDPNYQETPYRVAKYFGELFKRQKERDLKIQEMGKKVFPSLYDGIITVGPTRAYGLCPHHLLPVVYDITVGYIPKGKALGLSKLSRIPRLLAQTPELQEDLTIKIAKCLNTLLITDDVAVLVEGQHQCMQVRGVEEEQAITTTSVMWGRFTEDSGGCKAEFFRIVDRNRRR